MKDHPRSVRFSSQMQMELSAILRGSVLRDPRITGTDYSVTKVEVTHDLGHAAVFVSSLFANDAQLLAAVKALNHAAGRVRHELGLRLTMRYVPLLKFYPDSALREGDRISALISKVSAVDRGHQAARAEPSKPE